MSSVFVKIFVWQDKSKFFLNMGNGTEAHSEHSQISKMKLLAKLINRSGCKYLSEATHTINIEVFNNIILKYLPKQYHFGYDHIVMGTYLATLDNNFSSERGQDNIIWQKH